MRTYSDLSMILSNFNDPQRETLAEMVSEDLVLNDFIKENIILAVRGEGWYLNNLLDEVVNRVNQLIEELDREINLIEDEI